MFRRRISGVDPEVLHILRPTLRPGHDFVEIKADLPADPAVRHSQRLAHPQVREDVLRQSRAVAIWRASRNFCRRSTSRGAGPPVTAVGQWQVAKSSRS